MFERYTEKARRVIFFARYEASQVGNPYIESEHLLIGLLRESGHELRRYLGSRVTVEELRAEIAASSLRREPTPASVDLPLTNECKRILAYAAEEAARLGNQHIGTEHLLLGTLREKGCFAARLLLDRGLQLESARTIIAAAAREGGGTEGWETGFAIPVKKTYRGFRIVDKDTSELLLTLQESAPTPRVGDAILIGEEGSPARHYRVHEVVWEFTRGDGVHWLHDLVVKVVRDGAVPGADSGLQP